MKDALFVVDGMTCDACARSIEREVLLVDGVRKCSVSVLTKECRVQYDESQVSSLDTIKETIEDCGFDAQLGSSSSTGASNEEDSSLKTALFSVHGMTCNACTSAVVNAINDLGHVEKVDISLITEDCEVIYNPLQLSAEKIAEAIMDCGFDVDTKSVSVASATDDKCAVWQRAELKLLGDLSLYNDDKFFVPSSESVRILARSEESVAIEYNTHAIGIRDVIAYVEKQTGCETVLMSSMVDNADIQLQILARVKEIQFWKSICLKSSLIAIFLMGLYMWLPQLAPSMVSSHIFPYNSTKGVYYRDIIGFFLTTYVQFYIGSYFYKAFWNSLMHKAGTMDTLICISTSSAYFFSLYSIFHNVYRKSESLPNVIFSTCCMLVAFISFGKFLENKAKSKTSTALSKLISLTPKFCTIVLPSGELLETPIEYLQIGDLIDVKPGHQIPTDGTIVQGRTEVDESLMTGESMLVLKSIGGYVIGGSINGSGHFVFKAINTTHNSKLSNIIKTMKDAQLTKAPIQRVTDYLSSIFVPGILCLATLTFVVWELLARFLARPPAIFKDNSNDIFFICFQTAISVIVVACPCALGLAAPTAIMVGTGVGAEHGVLIKGGDKLEVFNYIESFVFDKTGTITTGCMQVKRFQEDLFNKVPTDYLFWACVQKAVETNDHPVAAAILRYCNEKVSASAIEEKIDIVDSEIFVGKGSDCHYTVNGEPHTIYIGNQNLMKEVVPGQTPLNESHTDDSFTTSYLAIDGSIVGQFLIEDSIKEDAFDTIKWLRDHGYNTYMVTGDTHNCALQMASQVGIPLQNVFSEVSPEGKCDIVQDLQKNSTGKVVFVGDGINDSPALVTSDLGVAISSGTDIAIEAADVVILSDSDPKRASLKTLIYALDISKQTIRRIQINLFWAVCYNTFMIPIAMGVLLPFGISLHPMVAALAMAMSSVSVVLSSLALKRWRPPIVIGSEMIDGTGTWTVGQWMKKLNVFHRDPSPSHRNDDIEMQNRLIE